MSAFAGSGACGLSDSVPDTRQKRQNTSLNLKKKNIGALNRSSVVL